MGLAAIWEWRFSLICQLFIVFLDFCLHSVAIVMEASACRRAGFCPKCFNFFFGERKVTQFIVLVYEWLQRICLILTPAVFTIDPSGVGAEFFRAFPFSSDFPFSFWHLKGAFVTHYPLLFWETRLLEGSGGRPPLWYLALELSKACLVGIR